MLSKPEIEVLLYKAVDRSSACNDLVGISDFDVVVRNRILCHDILPYVMVLFDVAGCSILKKSSKLGHSVRLSK